MHRRRLRTADCVAPTSSGIWRNRSSVRCGSSILLKSSSEKLVGAPRFNSGPLAPHARVAAFIVTRYDNWVNRFAKKTSRRGRPPTGNPVPAAERMRQMRARRRAAVPKAGRSRPEAGAVYSPHRVLDARSLAMHVMAAEKIDRDRKLLDVPRRNLERWKSRWGVSSPAWVTEWQEILSKPWPAIAALITELTENATRLRQSSPFAGVLSPSERRKVYEAFRP
jgi:hypothetical protein